MFRRRAPLFLGSHDACFERQRAANWRRRAMVLAAEGAQGAGRPDRSRRARRTDPILDYFFFSILSMSSLCLPVFGTTVLAAKTKFGAMNLSTQFDAEASHKSKPLKYNHFSRKFSGHF